MQFDSMIGQLLWSILGLFFPVLNSVSSLVDFCREKSLYIYQLTIQLWNVMTLQGMNYAAASPATSAPEGYQRVQSLAGVLASVAGLVLAICVLYRFIRVFNDSQAELRIGGVVRALMVMIICSAVTSNAMEIISAMLRMGSGLCQAVGLSATAIRKSETIMGILTEGNPGIPTLVFIIVLFFSILTTGAGMVIVIAQRILRILVMMPFAGVSFATIVAGGKLAEIGYSYLRSFGAYCVEGAVIILILSLGNGLVNNGLLGLFDSIVGSIARTDDLWGFFKIVLAGVCQMIGCSMVAGAVKMSDSWVHKAFGL